MGQLNTSDETLESGFNQALNESRVNNELLAKQFIAECRASCDRGRSPVRGRAERDEPRPSTSSGRGHGDDRMEQTLRRNYMTNETMTGDERAEQLIREAELSRARIFQIPGRETTTAGDGPSSVVPVNCDNRTIGGEVVNTPRFWHTSMVDESYLAAAAHVDDATRSRIIAGQYVDFARLLPKDRIQYMDEENRLECVVRGGQTYFVPAVDRNVPSINSFNRWDQAFMIFANIYLNTHQNRSSELLEYQYAIHTASTGFPWENVYSYDRDFRLHMAKYPTRSWAMILQQAWSMRLMNRGAGVAPADNPRGGQNDKRARKDICWRFNRGKCTYGPNCRFEHKCNICLKFGHGAHICRKAGGYDKQNRGGEQHRRDDRDKDRGKQDRHDRAGGSASKVAVV